VREEPLDDHLDFARSARTRGPSVTGLAERLLPLVMERAIDLTLQLGGELLDALLHERAQLRTSMRATSCPA